MLNPLLEQMKNPELTQEKRGELMLEYLSNDIVFPTLSGNDFKEYDGLTIKLDKWRKFRLDINALADLEETSITGFETIQDAFAGLDKNSMKAIRAILWAGLKQNNPDIKTPHDAGKLVKAGKTEMVIQAIGLEISRTMPIPGSDGTDPLVKIVQLKQQLNERIKEPIGESSTIMEQ